MDVAADHSSKPAFAPQPVPVVGTDVLPDLRPQMVDLRTKILQRIVAQTGPARLPKSWAWLGASKSTRHLSVAPDEIVASLLSEFSLEQLLATRIVEQIPNDEPRLSPVFGDPTASFVVRRDENDLPIDVISARGSVSGSFSEWVRLAGERVIGSEDCGQPVMVASTDDEVLLLHRLGLDFVPAAGLKNLHGKRVRELFDARPGRREKRKYKFTIPCWQIGECIHQPALKTVRALRRIIPIQTHFGHDPGSLFDVWLPEANEFRDICTARRFEDRRIVVAALRKSLSRPRHTPADALRLLSDREEPNYGDARAELERQIDASGLFPCVGEIGVALAKFEDAFKKLVTALLLAADDGSPWDRWRSMLAGELAATWFDTLATVIAARQILAGEYPGNRRIVDERLLNDQLRIVSSFVKLSRLNPPR